MLNNVVFFGTSDYCLPILESLRQNFDLKLVVTRPDKPVGRKKVLTPSATKTWAIEHKISVITPETLKKDTQSQIGLISQIRQIHPDFAVVSDFGLIIPEAIFNLPRLGTLNIHFSKLPDLRGPSPVQFTLLRGNTKAWVTIFKLEKTLDTGPILWQKPYPIHPDDTTQTLYLRLFQETARILPAIINDYSPSSYHPITLKPQDHSQATFCRFLTKADGFIPWRLVQQALQALQAHPLQKASIQSLPQIQQEALQTKHHGKQISNFKFQISNLLDFYRAMTPWPGLWTINPEGKRLLIRKCHLEENKLILDEVQFEGKKPQKVLQ